MAKLVTERVKLINKNYNTVITDKVSHTQKKIANYNFYAIRISANTRQTTTTKNIKNINTLVSKVASETHLRL